METCDSINLCLKPISQHHHQHDHITETQICTWYNTISKWWLNRRSTLTVANANVSIPTNTERKHLHVRSNNCRTQRGHPNPPPTRRHHRNSDLQMVWHTINNLLHVAVHSGYRTRKTSNPSKHARTLGHTCITLPRFCKYGTSQPQDLATLAGPHELSRKSKYLNLLYCCGFWVTSLKRIWMNRTFAFSRFVFTKLTIWFAW